MFPLISALVGSFLGSFATLLIYRLHSDEPGIVWGRSKCPKCEKILKALHLIPIFSWLFQRGKCAHCKESIPATYVLIELSFALVFFFFAHEFPDLLHHWPYFVAIFFALVLFWYDVQYLEVDRRISFPAIFFALVWAFFREGSWENFLIGGLIGFLFYFVQYFYSKGRWVGAGDMELGAFLGLLLGWEMGLVSLFAAYIGGSVITLPVLLYSKKFGMQSKVPMGAFLMPSLLVFLFSGEAIWEWYMGLFV